MQTHEITRRCASCRAEFADDRLSAHCVPCQARIDEDFRLASRVIGAELARIARARGNEAEAQRIERATNR